MGPLGLGSCCQQPINDLGHYFLLLQLLLQLEVQLVIWETGLLAKLLLHSCQLNL